jgi:hypothetical protein
MKQYIAEKDLNYLATVTAEGVSAEDFVTQIEDVIKKIFPKSFVQVRYSTSLGHKSIFIQFALGKDKSEWANGIIQNDPLHHQIWIYGIKDDGTLMDKVKMEAHSGGRLILKENDESGFRSKVVKIGFRSMTGTPEKILKGIGNYFTKAKKVFKEYQDRLRDLPEDFPKDKV